MDAVGVMGGNGVEANHRLRLYVTSTGAKSHNVKPRSCQIGGEVIL